MPSESDSGFKEILDDDVVSETPHGDKRSEKSKGKSTTGSRSSSKKTEIGLDRLANIMEGGFATSQTTVSGLGNSIAGTLAADIHPLLVAGYFDYAEGTDNFEENQYVAEEEQSAGDMVPNSDISGVFGKMTNELLAEDVKGPNVSAGLAQLVIGVLSTKPKEGAEALREPKYPRPGNVTLQRLPKLIRPFGMR